MKSRSIIEEAVNRLPEIYHQRGLSPVTTQVCRMMVDKSLTTQAEDLKAAVELCIGLCFIDSADGHTRSHFEFKVLRARLATLFTSGGESSPNESIDYDSLTHTLLEASRYLLSLYLHERNVFAPVNEDSIQFARMAELESQLDARIRVLSTPQVDMDLSSLSPGEHLTNEQRTAVFASIQNRLSVITGGPGTGKTSIIVELLRCVCSLGIEPYRIALAAPTGKAAYRMGESIQRALSLADDQISQNLIDGLPTPMTVHRLLDYRPWSGQFGRHLQAPIKADLIIIDEMSMVDAELALSILKALSNDTRLVLLGDPGQLPSVGAGAVLRDLVATQQVCTSTLTKSFRMNENDPAGSKVYQVSRWMLSSDTQLLTLPSIEGTWDDWAGSPPLGVHFASPSVLDLSSFVDAWYDRFYLDAHWRRLERPFTAVTPTAPDHKPLQLIFEHFSRARILCPTRVGPQGTIYLNSRFTARIRQAFSGDEIAGFGMGDLVMCMRNDYKLELFNGDQGVVISRVDEDSNAALWVAFEGGQTPRLYPLALLTHLLEHAFAITVHKSQGSEFETVALSLPEKSAIPVSKALVYTALTRAKREVLILGRQRAFFEASKQLLIRKTGLGQRLSKALEDGSKGAEN